MKRAIFLLGLLIALSCDAQIGTVTGSSGGGGNISAGTYASRPGSPTNGTLYFCTDAPAYLLYNSGAWTYWYNGMQVTPLVTANYSWTNQGGATVTAEGPYSFFNAPGAGGDNWRMYLRSLPSTPYTYTILIVPSSINKQYLGTGLTIYDGSAKLISFFVLGQAVDNPSNPNDGVAQLEISKYSNATTFSATYRNEALPAAHGPMWLQVVDNGTNFTFNYSLDGQQFTQYFTVSRTDFLTPTNIGVGLDANSAAGTTYPATMLVPSASQ